MSTYSNQLATNEGQIAKLRVEGRDMAAQTKQLEATLRDRIQQLEF